MPDINARFIVDNAAERSTLTASTTATNTAVANMLNDIKSDVHRSTAGTTNQYKMTWVNLESIGGVHLPWCNLSPTATIRVRGYSDTAATTQTYDSGVVLACAAPAIKLRGFTAAQAAQAYGYCGGAHARHWLPANGSYRAIVVDLADTNNLLGYIECAKIVAGSFWEVAYNPEYDADVSFQSLSKQTRDDDNNLRVKKGGRYRKQTMQFAAMDQTDRDAMVDLLRGNGLDIPFIFSMYPNHSNATLERDHQMWSQLVANPSMSIPSYFKWATGLDFESV